MQWQAEYVRHAEQIAQRVGLLPGSSAEALSVVSNGLGPAWVSDELQRQVTLWETIVSERRHPIAEAISTAGINQAVEIAEVAAYMKRLCAARGFDLWLNAFRTNYFSGLAQIAHAYRFLRSGAQELFLEPPVHGGKHGDIAFAFEGTRVVAECYCPEIELDPTATKSLAAGIPRIFSALSRHQCRVDIYPLVPIDARIRRKIVGRIEEGAAGPLPLLVQTGEFRVSVTPLEVTRTTWRKQSVDDISNVDPSAAWVVRSSSMYEDDVPGIRLGLDRDTRILSEIVVHLIPGFDQGLDWQRETLVKRIAKKARQARSGDANGAHRLLIVGYPRLAYTLGTQDPITHGLVTQVAKHLRSPCDILFVDRRWGANYRYVCIGEFASIGWTTSPIAGLIDLLREDELDRDPIADEGLGRADWPRHRSYFGSQGTGYVC